MAENIPGVRANEIDRSQPTPTGVTGIPAGVIGTAQQGPAFVPVTVSKFGEFESVFGAIDKVAEFHNVNKDDIEEYFDNELKEQLGD